MGIKLLHEFKKINNTETIAKCQQGRNHKSRLPGVPQNRSNLNLRNSASYLHHRHPKESCIKNIISFHLTPNFLFFFWEHFLHEFCTHTKAISLHVKPWLNQMLRNSSLDPFGLRTRANSYVPERSSRLQITKPFQGKTISCCFSSETSGRGPVYNISPHWSQLSLCKLFPAYPKHQILSSADQCSNSNSILPDIWQLIYCLLTKTHSSIELPSCFS